MIRIKTEIESINKQLQINPNDTDYQTTVLQEGLAEERDALYNIEAFLTLPFDLRSCNCSSLSAQQR
jgi:hypothetical protein